MYVCNIVCTSFSEITHIHISLQVDCGAAPGAWSQVAASKMMNTIVKPKKCEYVILR